MANDSFFEQFSALDDEVYADGAIPMRYKELTGLSISIATRCDECVDFHLGNCIKLGISLSEIKDANQDGRNWWWFNYLSASAQTVCRFIFSCINITPTPLY